jgi:hypothetical protein
MACCLVSFTALDELDKPRLLTVVVIIRYERSMASMSGNREIIYHLGSFTHDLWQSRLPTKVSLNITHIIRKKAYIGQDRLKPGLGKFVTTSPYKLNQSVHWERRFNMSAFLSAPRVLVGYIGPVEE